MPREIRPNDIIGKAVALDYIHPLRANYPLMDAIGRAAREVIDRKREEHRRSGSSASMSTALEYMDVEAGRAVLDELTKRGVMIVRP